MDHTSPVFLDDNKKFLATKYYLVTHYLSGSKMSIGFSIGKPRKGGKNIGTNSIEKDIP